MKPREHAAYIMSLATREERREALERIEPPWKREWVRDYVVNAFALRACRRRRR